MGRKRKAKKKKKKGPRGKVSGRPGFYVVRDKFGRFKEWSAIEKSIKVDARQKAPKATKPGHGHRKDYPQKKKKKKASKK